MTRGETRSQVKFAKWERFTPPAPPPPVESTLLFLTALPPLLYSIALYCSSDTCTPPGSVLLRWGMIPPKCTDAHNVLRLTHAGKI